MRALDLLLGAGLLAALLYLLWFLLGRSDRSHANRAVLQARWRAHNESRGGVTSVVVRRTTTAPDGSTTELESREVASIRDDDPAYDLLLTEAMTRARARAELLERETRSS